MKAASHLIAASFAFVLAGPLGAQVTWYVDGVQGNDTNPGTSAAMAFQTISKAITVVSTGETIMVASAIYSPTKGDMMPFHVPRGVRLVGQDPRTCIIDCEAVATGYTGHMVVLPSDTTLSGFTLRNAPHSSQNWWAGAIACSDSPSLVNVLIERCILDTVPRGIYINGRGASVQNLTVRNNFIVRSSSDAISVWADSTMGSTGSVFHNNTIVGGDPNHVTRSHLVFNGITADVFNNNLYGFDFCGIEIDPQATINAYNNNYYMHIGSFGGTYCVDPLAVYTQTGDTANDPMLISPTDDPHLKYYSPCIDAGSGLATTTDIDGNGLQGSAIDQGCDESIQDYLQSDVYLWPVIAAGESATIVNVGQGANGVILYGATQLSLAGPINMGSMGILHIDPLTMFVLMTGTMSRSGTATLTFQVPNDPSLLGPWLYLQGLHFTPTLQSLGLTDLEAFTIGR